MNIQEETWWLIFIIVVTMSVILIVFINSWQNGFKTTRQLCEENGGIYIEDLSAHNQNKCMYSLGK